MQGKTGGKKAAKKKTPPRKAPVEKPMSHGEKYKAMMDHIPGDPEC